MIILPFSRDFLNRKILSVPGRNLFEKNRISDIISKAALFE